MITPGYIVHTIGMQIGFMALPIEELIHGCQGATRKANIGFIIIGSASIGTVLLGKMLPAIEQNAQKVDRLCQYAIVGLISWRTLCSALKQTGAK